jgi:hypothetical protein
MSARAPVVTEVEPLVADSITHLDRSAAGRTVVCASHAGAYVAVYAAGLRVAAIVLNDAGVGREEAGIAGLPMLDEAGIAAVAVSHDSARIGDAADTLARGRLSSLNDLALRLGCRKGMTVADAVSFLAEARPGSPLPTVAEVVYELEPAPRRVMALDSIALVTPAHADAVVMSGSHGGLLGGRAEAALKYDVRGAVFNDAGRGIEDAGCGRLWALDGRGIAAAVVDTFSARIGDARSTYEDGIVSAVNQTARDLGAAPGIGAREFAALVHEAAGTDGIDG